MSYYEYNHPRFRIIAGDLSMGDEDFRSTEFSAGFEFGLDVNEFCTPNEGPDRRNYDLPWDTYYVSHAFCFQVWRWGIYVSVRGKAV